MPKEIRFCQPIGEYYFLSPLSAHPIKMVYYFLSPLSAHPIKMVVDGQEYGFPTVEHYYQAMKFYASDKRFETIIGLKNPDDARLLTKTPEYKINRRKDFDKIKFDIMEKALYAKFKQNPYTLNLSKILMPPNY